MKHYHIFDTFYKGYPIPNGSDFGKLHGDYLKHSLTDVNKWYTEKNGQTFPVCLSDNDMIDAILDAEKISIYDIEDKNFKGTFIYQLHMFGGEGNSFPEKIDEPSILHSISKKALEYIRSGKVKFIINYFIEGVFNYHHFNVMHKHLEELEIPSEKVYFIFGGFNTKNWYESFCKNYNIQNKINIVELSWVRLHKFEEFFHMALDSEKNKSLQNEYTVEKKEYDFLCYNRRLRLHRELFLAFLKRYDLLEKNLVSYDYTFFENKSKVNDFDRFKHHDVWPYVRFMRGEFDFLWNEKPKQTVDVDDVSCIWGGTIESEWKEPYRKSMFSVVTETSLRNTEYYVSEKIFKPIGQKHPFVVVGSHLSLAELRSWGFKTFEPYINESYDNEPNYFVRLEMVLQETKRLCNLSDDEKIRFMKNIEPIVKYNWNHLIHLFKNNYSWLEDKMREIGFEFESKEYVSPHPLDRESILWK